MWMLEITLVHAVTRVAFTSEEKALTEQANIQKLMGIDIYERNREKSERTYKIQSDHETCVINIQSVQAVSVVEPLEFEKAQSEHTKYKEERRRDAFIEDCRIMKEYGIRV